MTDVTTTLEERGGRYGGFPGNAMIAQDLKRTFYEHAAMHGRGMIEDPVLREAADMIFHKFARIANGDPFYDDSWRDIAGYAQLVVAYLDSRKEGS